MRISNIFAFAIGFGLGGLVLHGLSKRKYERLIEEEVLSVKKSFSRLYRDMDNTSIPTPVKKEEEAPMSEKEYVEYSNTAGLYKTQDDIDVSNDSIVVISPDEFAAGDPDYDFMTFTFKEGVVFNSFDEVVEDPEVYIGDNLSLIGGIEPSVLYIRNDDLRTFFEILEE